MFVNTQQVQMGVTKFIENELGHKAVGFDIFKIYFLLPIINNKIVGIVQSFAENSLTKDMFDENKHIDIDSVYNMAKNAIQKSGKFMMAGIVFDEGDVDKLYRYIRGEI